MKNERREREREKEAVHRNDNVKNMRMYILSRWLMFCVLSAVLLRRGLCSFLGSLERMVSVFRCERANKWFFEDFDFDLLSESGNVEVQKCESARQR